MSRKEKGVNSELIALMTGAELLRDEAPTVAMLPGSAACIVARRIKSHELHLYEFDLRSGERESFLPVAEMYMGKLMDDIPEHERKLHKHQTMQRLKEGEETT